MSDSSKHKFAFIKTEFPHNLLSVIEMWRHIMFAAPPPGELHITNMFQEKVIEHM